MNTTLTMSADRLYLDCSDMHTPLAKQVPGMSYRRKEKKWSAPLSPLAVAVTWDVFRGKVDISDAVSEYMREAVGLVSHLAGVKDGLYEHGDHPRYNNLWPLQRNGVDFLVEAKKAFLCDSMGSGKTVQCYRALDCTGAYPALVVANKSALYTAWGAEGHKWCDSAEHIIVVDGSAAVRRKALEAARVSVAAGHNTVVIVGWAVLAEHSRLDPYGNVALTDKEKTPKELNAFDFRTVIIDEAHKAKSWKAKRTRALWAVAHKPTVEYRWALTGTPVTGYEEDVWAIGHTVQPEMYPRKTQWIDRYVDVRTLPGRDYPIVAGFRPENYDEMIKYLDPYMLRRTKAEIIPDYQGKLPLRTVQVTMGGAQKKAYKQMEADMLTRGEDGILAALSPIEQLLRLNQFAAATPTITEDEGGDLKVASLKNPSCKTDALLEILDELGEAPAVVFAESRLLIDHTATVLDKAGVTYMRITGGESGPHRAANQEAFQAGKVRVALCTYGAGAESITLSRADTVIRMQRSYNLVSDTQAPDRVDRGERTVPVQIIDIVTAGTVESQVHARVDEKTEIFQEVVRDTLRGMQ